MRTSHACIDVSPTFEIRLDASSTDSRFYSRTTYQAQHEPVDGDDVVLPDDVVDGVDALVDVRPAGRVGHLEH